MKAQPKLCQFWARVPFVVQRSNQRALWYITVSMGKLLLLRAYEEDWSAEGNRHRESFSKRRVCVVRSAVIRIRKM